MHIAGRARGKAGSCFHCGKTPLCVFGKARPASGRGAFMTGVAQGRKKIKHFFAAGDRGGGGGEWRGIQLAY